MVKWLIRGLLIAAFLGPIACSDNSFESAPNAVCVAYQRDFGSGGCVYTPQGYQFNYRVTSGDVDMLFVDDNSGSMYQEQVKMADRFPGFLDSIYRLSYRIGIITTDISVNGGGLLSFPDNTKFLSNTSRVMDARHQQNISHFQNTIKRQETLNCDQAYYNPAFCPAGDERGVYALNLAIGRSDQRSFFRTGGHLAVVILSDEDERSNGGLIPGFPIEPMDEPLTFVQRANQLLGATKSISVHSIIIKPGDSACLSAQNTTAPNGNSIRGFEGTFYAALSNPSAALMSAGNIRPGEIGSICSTNYTTELGNIAARLNQHQPPVLPCLPKNGIINISYDPVPGSAISYQIDSSRRLLLTPTPTAGQQVNLSFTCETL